MSFFLLPISHYMKYSVANSSLDITLLVKKKKEKKNIYIIYIIAFQNMLPFAFLKDSTKNC